MKKVLSTISVLSVFLIAGIPDSFGKQEKFVVHYKDKQVDTVYSYIQFSETGEHFLDDGSEIINASSTEEIEYISSEKEVIKGFSSGGNWFFKVLEGHPVSLYSMDPDKYKASELFFSVDNKRFIPCTRDNLKSFFGNNEVTGRELDKYLSVAGIQRVLLYTNITAAPGLMIGLATPVGIGLVGYGVASTGISMLMNKPVKRKLYDLVEEFNKIYKNKEDIQEEFQQRYSQL